MRPLRRRGNNVSGVLESGVSRARTWRWIGALALVPLALFCAGVLHPAIWAWLGIMHFQQYFLDLVAVLAAGKAHVLGQDVYARNVFDPFGRPHVYGPWWLYLGRLGLEVGDAPWFGAVLGLTFVVVAAASLAPRGVRSFAWSVALLASPPVLLTLERGNNDLAIFIIIVIASWLLARTSERSAAGGMALLVTAAALKLYPAAALGAAGLRPTRRSAAVLIIGAFVACAWVAWYWQADYRHALAHTPRPTSMLAYGAAIAALTWQTLVPARLWLIVGAVVALSVFAVPLFRGRRELWLLVPAQRAAGIAFVAAGLCWILCYAATTNYAYRVILLLLPAAVWLSCLEAPRTRSVARWQLLGWAVVFWMPVVKRFLGVAVLDADHAVAMRGLGVVLGFEQALIGILTAALAYQIAGALIRCATSSAATVQPQPEPVV